MIDAREFGKLIKDLRIQANMTQAQLAKNIDVSDVYISLIEQGKRFPSMEIQRAIQHWLHNHCFCPYCKRRL